MCGVWARSSRLRVQFSRCPDLIPERVMGVLLRVRNKIFAHCAFYLVIRAYGQEGRVDF